MADNFALSAGTGDGIVVATDDIGPGVHYQIIKLAFGALDSATLVTTLAGLPVQLVSPIGAGVEATALRVTIATDSTGVLSVDDNAASLTVDNAALSVVGGGLEATALRVTLASDSTGVISVDDNGGNLSIDWAGTVPPIGAGTEAAALRVTLATDSTGVVSVDDNGGALTVDGTVAVTHAALTALNGAITGTEVQCDVLTLPAVTIAAAQTLATVTTVGAVTAITNALPAGDNNIGNMDIVSLPAGNLGMQAMAASLSIVPASNITDATYIGDIKFGEALLAGTNLIGDVDIAPRATGGWSVGNYTSGDTYTALTATAQVIKAGAGKFGGYYIYNPNAAASYVMIYNIAAASVTVGTSTAKLVFCIPATSGANLELLAGIPFDTAMSIAAATTAGGNTAPTTALEAMVFFI